MTERERNKLSQTLFLKTCDAVGEINRVVREVYREYGILPTWFQVIEPGHLLPSGVPQLELTWCKGVGIEETIVNLSRLAKEQNKSFHFHFVQMSQGSQYLLTLLVDDKVSHYAVVSEVPSALLTQAVHSPESHTKPYRLSAEDREEIARLVKQSMAPVKAPVTRPPETEFVTSR